MSCTKVMDKKQMNQLIKQQVIDLFGKRVETLEKARGCHRLAGLETQYIDATFKAVYDNSSLFNKYYLESHYNGWILRSWMTSAGIIVIPILLMILLMFFWMLYDFATSWTVDFLSLMVLFSVLITGFLFATSWFANVFIPYNQHKFRLYSQRKFYFGEIIGLPLSRAVPVRYNRQAQVVHVMYDAQQLTLRWKEVVAFDVRSANNVEPRQLMLVFPGQPEVLGYSDPISFNANFSSIECSTIDSAISRWEHLRLFMEKGFESIQPRGNRNAYEYLHLGLEEKDKDKYYLGKYLFFGWVTTYFMDRNRERFQWSEEIQALSAPDAKEKGLLDRYDTRPVIATKVRKITT